MYIQFIKGEKIRKIDFKKKIKNIFPTYLQILRNSETWQTVFKILIIFATIIGIITCIIQIFAMIKYLKRKIGKKTNPETSIAEPPPFNIRCESKIKKYLKKFREIIFTKFFCEIALINLTCISSAIQ